MNAAPSLTSIRPASGRTFVRVSSCGELGNLPSTFDLRLSPMHATHADLWAQAHEDQVPPGGGRA